MKFPEELQFILNSRMKQHITDARLDGKVAVISGATSGIGYETARLLAKGGAQVVMLCRNIKKAEAVRQQLADEYGAKADVFIADFQKLDEVSQAAEEISQKFAKIHILINNAGVFNKRRQLTPDGHEMTFAVIHLASFLLTNLLLENLKNGAPARVIDISSEAHRFGGFNINDLNWKKRPYIGLWAYGAAEIAQLQTASYLAEKLKDSSVTVNAMHPGAVRTNIGMNNNFFYRFYSRYILRWFLKDPRLSAKAIYYLAAAPEMETITGEFFNQTIEEKPAWYTIKPEMRQPIWEHSLELVKPYLKGSL